MPGLSVPILFGQADIATYTVLHQRDLHVNVDAPEPPPVKVDSGDKSHFSPQFNSKECTVNSIEGIHIYTLNYFLVRR